MNIFQENLFKIFGEYNQQFMYIKLHSPTHSTLFHEYIHHLQNVTTYYSINAFLCIKSFYYDLIAKRKKWDDSLLMRDLYINDIKRLTETLGERIDEYFSDVKICNIKNIKNGNVITNLELHLLIDNESKLKKYKLGTVAIKECMANIIEQKYYPNENSNSTLTYHICYLLICHICPNLKNNLIVIVAILELSLMFPSPVDLMIKLLVILKNKEEKNITIESIYNIIYNFEFITIYTNGKGYKGTFADINADVNEIFERIDNRLDIIYLLFADSDGNTFEPFKNWQKSIKRVIHNKKRLSIITNFNA